jgi:hypothetical protein
MKTNRMNIKIALWKTGMLLLALALLMALGAFAEGTIGLFPCCLLVWALVEGIRFACLQMERCEAAVLRRARRHAAGAPRRAATHAAHTEVRAEAAHSLRVA